MTEIKFTGATYNDGKLCLTVDGYGDKIRARELCLSAKGTYIAEIKQYHEKRSLNANALFWKAVGIIAEAVGSDNWSVYINLLRDYGQYTYIIVKPNAVPWFKANYRICEEVGEVEINGKKGIQMLCFRGSSTYDKKQMARLIDGAIQELDNIGIEFAAREDVDRAVEDWEAQRE